MLLYMEKAMADVIKLRILDEIIGEKKENCDRRGEDTDPLRRR